MFAKEFFFLCISKKLAASETHKKKLKFFLLLLFIDKSNKDFLTILYLNSPVQRRPYITNNLSCPKTFISSTVCVSLRGPRCLEAAFPPAFPPDLRWCAGRAGRPSGASLRAAAHRAPSGAGPEVGGCGRRPAVGWLPWPWRTGWWRSTGRPSGRRPGTSCWAPPASCSPSDLADAHGRRVFSPPGKQLYYLFLAWAILAFRIFIF